MGLSVDYSAYILLLLRMLIGINFLVGRGYPQLTSGRSRLVENMSKFGVPKAATYAGIILNSFGAIFLIVGLAVRMVAFLFAFEMAVTVYLQKCKIRSPYFGQKTHGYEINVCYLVLAVALIIGGGGSFSLDRLFGF